MDDSLKRRAHKNEGKNARTYVVCTDDRVVGYYCLAAGSITRAEATKKVVRNAPDPIPVVIVARLAVDQTHHGQGLGKFLLKDALLRAIAASKAIGVRAVLVHALDNDAVGFYEQFGFQASPIDERTLMLPIEIAIAALE